MRRQIVAAAAFVSGIALSTAAYAAPPDQIFKLTVLSDTLQVPAVCGPGGTPGPYGPCKFSEGPAHYQLATLTLTHDALTQHTAQWIDGCNLDGPGSACLTPIDDGRVVSFAGPNGYDHLKIPLVHPEEQKLWIPGNGFIFDLQVGDHLSGTIRVAVLPPEHNTACYLTMTGNNNNWAGTWTCGGPPLSPLHSFTAISKRVNGNERVSERD